VRDGFNGAANGYDRLSERLTFGFSWPSLEFKYSRSFAVPGQTGNDTVTFSVNSNF